MTRMMTRVASATLLTVAGGIALAPAAATAQGKCPEGRTASGECVNPGLAATARLTATIFSQPKISKTAFPILPFDDRVYRYPNQLIPDPLKAAPAFSVSP
jgi:hypothetical protein